MTAIFTNLRAGLLSAIASLVVATVFVAAAAGPAFTAPIA
jgi:hypothetical protein